MHKKIFGFLFILGVILMTMVMNIPPSQAAPAGFVYTEGSNFMLDGEVFRFGGANNYYLHYKSELMIDDVLNDALAMNLRVIRCWAFMDGPGQEGIMIQPALGEYNDSGFARLDYTLYRAETLGLKLILVLTNNWDDFGGMSQYVQWTGAGSHDDFYTNSQCKQAYKDYANYLINRVNPYTGKKYKESPAIFAWELANEPRCQSDPSGDTLVSWANEMSAYIKSLDPYHLVSVGDEGFFNRPGSSDWFYSGGEGVDWDRLIALPNIDFGTVHLYPDHWGKDVNWGTQWIIDHAGQDKPIILEEYGIRGNKESVYPAWCDAVLDHGYAGSCFWILTGIQDDGNLYADYDGFRVTYPSAVATILANHAMEMALSGGWTPTPTPTATPTPTPTPPPGDECVVLYEIQNDWGQGATINVTIKNNSSAPINGWTLEWTFPGNQEISNLWCADYTQSGSSVSVKNMSWNSTIPANGGQVDFGFNVTYTGINPEPGAFLLNGAPCQVE